MSEPECLFLPCKGYNISIDESNNNLVNIEYNSKNWNICYPNFPPEKTNELCA